MSVHRMIVIGLFAMSSGPALASAGSSYQSIGDLQRMGEEGRGTARHGIPVANSTKESATSGLGLGELQQRGEEGRGEPGPTMKAAAPKDHPVDLGDAQRRGEEGRGAPTPDDVASRL